MVIRGAFHQFPDVVQGSVFIDLLSMVCFLDHWRRALVDATIYRYQLVSTETVTVQNSLSLSPGHGRP